MKYQLAFPSNSGRLSGTGRSAECCITHTALLHPLRDRDRSEALPAAHAETEVPCLAGLSIARSPTAILPRKKQTEPQHLLLQSIVCPSVIILTLTFLPEKHSVYSRTGTNVKLPGRKTQHGSKTIFNYLHMSHFLAFSWQICNGLALNSTHRTLSPAARQSLFRTVRGNVSRRGSDLHGNRSSEEHYFSFFTTKAEPMRRPHQVFLFEPRPCCV